jgi:hypothetical protein
VSKHFFSTNNNTTDATSGAETEYHSGAPEITPVFSGGIYRLSTEIFTFYAIIKIFMKVYYLSSSTVTRKKSLKIPNW